MTVDEIHSTTTAPDPDGRFAAEILLPRRSPGRWIAGAVALVLVYFVASSLLTKEGLEWAVIGKYLFSEGILHGLLNTLWLTVVVMLLGFLFGIGLAAMRLSKNPVLRSISWTYVWIFRSVPMLVQILFWFNIGYLYPQISFGIPWGPTFFRGDANEIISATTAAILALTAHEAAYASEIIRGGILGVDQGQTEASVALGVPQWRILLQIVLPQAMRTIVPAAGNMLIGTLKGTSIVSIIAVSDLLYAAQFVYNKTFQVVPLLVVATIWYVAVTSLLSVGQYFVERHYARGAVRVLPPTPWRRLIAALQGHSTRRTGA
ncbi:ABC transporter permease subunit [Nakamurella sp. YIM 132087]|uniref:ABC transporter permease subunit n=1 Tax=Nakamurella alba TaxID=2665158 RepID=A0A7K1FSY8_9ACTN|nr:amino acid ABC transporter permease [Nakamurella alba]MTD16293.1 ABC transporter permease subunit [Nakamurella alba]